MNANAKLNAKRAVSIQKTSLSIQQTETGEMGEGRWGKVVGHFYLSEDRYFDGNLVQTLPALPTQFSEKVHVQNSFVRRLQCRQM